MSVLKITKDNFEKEVLKSDKPILLDFWASWCGPCRMVGPIVDVKRHTLISTNDTLFSPLSKRKQQDFFATTRFENLLQHFVVASAKPRELLVLLRL